MQTLSRIFLSGLLLTTIVEAPAVYAEDINVAVATNFLGTAKSLAQRFEAETKNTVRISSGSTGKLFAQIKEGAPFDILLSADIERPRLLEEQGVAVNGSRFTYAVGQLVLWSAQTDLVDAEAKVLKSGNFRHLAIANPKIAPYGKAAQQVLTDMGLWENLQPSLVRGEDIGQTFQFVFSGNAELGFVALSQVRNPDNTKKGSQWVVPQNLYDPIEQQAVLLKRAENKRAAQDFLVYLKSAEARQIISEQGYRVSEKL